MLVSTNIVIFVRIDSLASFVDAPLECISFCRCHEAGRFGQSTLPFGMFGLCQSVD